MFENNLGKFDPRTTSIPLLMKCASVARLAVCIKYKKSKADYLSTFDPYYPWKYRRKNLETRRAPIYRLVAKSLDFRRALVSLVSFPAFFSRSVIHRPPTVVYQSDGACEGSDEAR